MEEIYEKEPKLDGIVEVDETYVGGNYDKAGGGPWENKP